jgi:hypothetical protein
MEPEPLVLQLVSPVLLAAGLRRPADATRRPEPGRANLGRRGYLRRIARERQPDVEPANPLRFRQTEAARCCARA